MSEREAEKLTEREHEVAQLIAKGLTNAEIARRLGISFGTAKWHVSQVLAKTGADGRSNVASSLHADAQKLPRGRSFWSLGMLVKPLGLAATVVPVAAIAMATVLVLTTRGTVDEPAGAVGTEATTLPVQTSVSRPPQVETPATQAHTCDWQLAQTNLNGGRLDHSGCDFSGVNFGERGMMWNMAILAGANMSGAVIAGTFARADFSNANLRGTRFVQSVFGSANFRGADLTGADFTNSILNDGDFAGAVCPDAVPAAAHGGTCIGTKGLRNMPTTRSFAPGAAMAGKRAPDFHVGIVAGDGDVSLATFRGRPLVLVWTASWCFTAIRCDDLFAKINASARTNPDVSFLALSLDDTEAEARADAATRGFTFPVALDTDMAVAAEYHVIGAGMFVVVDELGNVAPFVDAAGQALDLDVVLAGITPHQVGP